MLTKYILRSAFTFLFIVLPVQLIGALLLPFVLLFIDKDQEHLPKAFRWYDNAEYYWKEALLVELFLGRGHLESEIIMETRLDGLAGPMKHRMENGIYPTADYNRFKHLWHRYTWLAHRNAVNYFKYRPLGFRIEPGAKIVHESGPKDVNIGLDDPRGTYLLVIESGGKVSYAVHYVKEYFFMGKIRAVRMRLGHKFDSSDLTDPLKSGTISQWVFNFSPFRTID